MSLVPACHSPGLSCQGLSLVVRRSGFPSPFPTPQQPSLLPLCSHNAVRPVARVGCVWLGLGRAVFSVCSTELGSGAPEEVVQCDPLAQSVCQL